MSAETTVTYSSRLETFSALTINIITNQTRPHLATILVLIALVMTISDECFLIPPPLVVRPPLHLNPTVTSTGTRVLPPSLSEAPPPERVVASCRDVSQQAVLQKSDQMSVFTQLKPSSP